MKGTRLYLDHNATSPLRPEVAEACAAAAGAGNPSSVHAEGRRGRALVEAARREVAALVGARAEDVVFTSGGTEANNAALRPGALRTEAGAPVDRLLVSPTEHPSVLSGHGFPPEAVEVLAVDGAGLLDLEDLARRLHVGPPALVSVQVANSETGALQPLAAIAEQVRAAGAVLHADAVQAAGRVPLGMEALGVDALSLSAHKLGGPMGIGALVLRPVRSGAAPSFIRGGGQERGRRGGTENVAGCVGFGVAARLAAAELGAAASRLGALRDAAEAGLRRLAPDLTVFGAAAPRLPNTLLFGVPGVAAETVLIGLDLAGVAASSGSACSSGKVGRSHVLAAMGVRDEIARGALRLSFGWSSGEEDVGRFLAAYENVLQRLYERERARAA